MNAENLAQECFRILQVALEDAFAENKKSDERIAFVYRHAVTIQRLAEDVIHLEATGHHYSSAIIVRSILECLFNLVAAVEHPNFAVEKLVWEMDKEVKNIHKWIKTTGDDPNAFDETIKSLESLASSLRQRYNILTPLNWNAFECAKAADLADEYRREYFIYSKAVHATTSGIVSRENRVGHGHIIQTVLYALLHATGNMVQVVPTKNAQGYIDTAADLIGELTELIKAGHFRNLDKAQQIPSAE
jgi:hypothetical protein